MECKGPDRPPAGTASLPSDAEMDARVARTRAAVVRAATDLLVEGGPAAVTIDAIVARSGVAKSTIYRHWPSRDDVLLDVFETCAPTLAPPDPALGFEGGLRQLVRSIVEIFADPDWTRIVPSLLQLKVHELGIAHLEQRLEDRQMEVVGAVLERGRTEGAIGDYELHEACAILVGPLLFGQLTGSVKLDEAFADRAVDAFLAAYRP